MDRIKKIRANSNYQIKPESKVIKTIDMHTAGEPLRVIIEGFPELQGSSILEYRNFVKNHYDHLRTSLMYEPRGHADMYGCILTPPHTPNADFGILFMHNEGYSTMCGHGTIAIAKLAVEMKWVDPVEPITHIRIDAPCGLINAMVEYSNGLIGRVSFDNVPSFVADLDQVVHIEGVGSVTYDLAYGGAFYAFVDARKLGLELVPDNYRKLIETGMAIKRAVMKTNEHIKHPFEEDLSFLYGTIFIGEPVSSGMDSRNVCIFAEGEVDRSPTGSGVSARMALHHIRNQIQVDEWMSIESIIGTSFKTCVKEVVNYGGFEAVVPRVEGTAYVTGQHEFIIDPNDPLKEGFILR